jgi:hypothetical protein
LTTPDIVGGGINDLLVVNGDLDLNGLVNVFGINDFGPGTYTLIDVKGALNPGVFALGFVPIDGLPYRLIISDPAGPGAQLLLSVPEPMAALPLALLWLLAIRSRGRNQFSNVQQEATH